MDLQLADTEQYGLFPVVQNAAGKLQEHLTLLVTPVAPLAAEAGGSKRALNLTSRVADKIKVTRCVGTFGVELNSSTSDQNGRIVFLKKALHPRDQRCGALDGFRLSNDLF